jgi:hypothetical protein
MCIYVFRTVLTINSDCFRFIVAVCACVFVRVIPLYDVEERTFDPAGLELRPVGCYTDRAVCDVSLGGL